MQNKAKMPYRRRRRRRGRKRKYDSRKRRYTRRKRRFRLARTPFGMSKLVKHKIIFPSVTLSAGLGVAVSHDYLANGMYDPDYHIGGHQPFYFDQMALIYQHWCVLGFRARVVARQDTNITALLGLFIDSSATSPLSTEPEVRTRLEQGGCVYTLLNGANQIEKLKPLHLKCNPNKFLGIGSPKGNELVRGDDSSDPPEKCYFRVVALPLQAGTVGITCYIELEYIALWTEPRNGPGS